ncbi:MAG: FecR domain-containing protein [Planctomycetes bacterium]|nr:FecR domain-containing protein [Planctomycetota bacterium]
MSDDPKTPETNEANNASRNDGGAGERNVERLLNRAYEPEAGPDEAYAQRVLEKMKAAQRERASANAAPQDPLPAQPPQTPKPQPEGPQVWIAGKSASPPSTGTAPKRGWWPLLAAAALVALCVTLYLNYGGPDVRVEGENVVWIDGKAYYANPEAGSDGEGGGAGSSANPLWKPATYKGPDPSLTLAALDYGLTARPHEEKAPEKIALKATVETKAGERRRIALPDGSILFVNEKSKVTIDAERSVTLSAGQLYVEVAPRKEAKPGATFVVKTPEKEVSAFGTKFAVDAAGEIFVTQGKVQVSGLDGYVLAGQQLGKDATAPESAPRASHLLAWTRPLLDEAASPLVPQSPYCGGALIAVDPYGQEARLSLRKYHVDVHVEDGFARTTIDQTYFNNESWRMEGTFYFPLPPDASLSRLAMYVEGKLMEGGMAERDYARNVFEQIVHRQKDPALLEWVDGSTFKMRVFPLEGRQEKRIVISYTQRLETLYGCTTYRFPAGHNLDIVRDWSFRMAVKNGAQLAASGSDQWRAETQGNDLVLAGEAHKIKPNRDVVVELYDQRLAAKGEETPRLSTHSLDRANYLLLRLRPDLATAQATTPRRDWIFLFESAGDRDPVLARAQIEIIRTLLKNAGHDDTFALLAAGTRVELFDGKARPVTPENVKEALGFLEKTHLLGALDLEAALKAASNFAKAAQNPVLVHTGSGVPVLGEKQDDVLAKSLDTRIQYVGVGVGKRWGRAFMKQAAGRSGGLVAQINPDEEIAWRAFELFSTLNTPRLLNVKVVDDAERVTWLAYSDALSQGEELAAAVRIPPGGAIPLSVTVTGMLNGQQWTRSFKIGKMSPGAGYLPRQWAKLEIERLLAEDAAKNKDSIVNLSKQMYVMSPFTSLLVLENEEMYKQFNVDRGRKDHWALYPCPGKIDVVYEPLPGQPKDPRAVVPENTAQATQRPSQAEVLQSILVRVPVPVLYWPNRPYNYAGVTLTAYQIVSGDVGWGWGWYGGDWRSWQRRDGENRMRQWAANNEMDIAGEPQTIDGYEYLLDEGLPQGESTTVPSGATIKLGSLFAAKPGMPVAQSKTEADSQPMSIDRISRLREANMPMARPMEESLAKPQAGRWGMNFADNRRRVAGGKDRDISKESADFEADDMVQRLNSGWSFRELNYQRPYFNNNIQAFSDLLAYAPGMNTSRADIQAVLAAEARTNARPGTIADEARTLIDRARGAGWQKLSVDPGDGGKAFDLVFDASGRFAFSRVTKDGIDERVACDGAALWHLYPAFGVGAKRAYSGFHRTELAGWVPWLLPSPADLARGADLVAIDAHTVAVVPHGANEAKDADGKPVPYRRAHLVFGGDGRLTERLVVEMPTGKTVYRETYAADGTVAWFDADGKKLGEQKLKLAETSAPALDAEAAAKQDKLVVLPMPIRTPAQVQQARNLKLDGNYQDWSDEDAMAYLSAMVFQNAWEARRMIGLRYFAKGDRRPGFYTLLTAGNANWDPQNDEHLGGDVRVRFDSATDIQGPLGKYLAQLNELRRTGHYNKTMDAPGGPADGYFARMTDFFNLFNEWNGGKYHQYNEADKAKARDRAMAFVRECPSAEQAWGVLNVVLNYANTPQMHGEFAGALKRFESVPELAYIARYERARSKANSGDWQGARAEFKELYEEALKTGALPPIDWALRSAYQQGNDAQQAWQDLMKSAAKQLLDAGRRTELVRLAWQVRQVGDPTLAEDLFAEAFVAPAKDETLALAMAGIEYLWQAGQLPRAEALIEPLLSDERYSRSASLWQLAGRIAEQRGRLAHALHCAEQAMELSFQNLPDVINVQALRQDFGALLYWYQRVADAVATLETTPPERFVARVVRAADRWRALDSDPTAACQAAARILNSLGLRELAWDYLTTPLAARPNEAQPWLSLASVLMQQGDLALADRAYALAFEAEPTNAQILWDRAQALLQNGRREEARKLYKQLADGEWQPRFQWIKQQAQRYTELPQ